jgi:hypothetical protein
LLYLKPLYHGFNLPSKINAFTRPAQTYMSENV